MAKIPVKLKTLAEEALAGDDIVLVHAVRQVVETYIGELQADENDRQGLQRLLDEDKPKSL